MFEARPKIMKISRQIFRMMTLHVYSGNIVKPSFGVPLGNRNILSHFVYVLLIVCNVSHHRSMKSIRCAELCACVRAVCVFLNPHIYLMSSGNTKYIITPQNWHQISLSITRANKAKRCFRIIVSRISSLHIVVAVLLFVIVGSMKWI